MDAKIQKIYCIFTILILYFEDLSAVRQCKAQFAAGNFRMHHRLRLPETVLVGRRQRLLQVPARDQTPLVQ